MAADYTVSFDSPRASSQRNILTTGTIPGDNKVGYLRIAVTASRTSGTVDTYYRTLTISPTKTTYPFSGTYNVAIVPPFTTGTISYKYAFSFTAKS